ncbi:MAG: hypothetical protein IIZ64_01765 [Erysipelotrichaceae bacterium]|nr:hypothetical protein [Erysipelotrichaceae bacterium]MBQ1533526.1 hypothetical protein [Erysipelotrichaceae bacterium]
MKSRWTRIARVLIVFFLMILFMNAMALFVNIKRDVNYVNRAYGLSTLDDCFNEGQYQQLYEYTVKNEFSNEPIEVDISQYEAFGRYWHAYSMARIYPDNGEYLRQMEIEKASITWSKILNVIDTLEQEMK